MKVCVDESRSAGESICLDGSICASKTVCASESISRLYVLVFVKVLV